jgi:molecular chaperone Hsp33
VIRRVRELPASYLREGTAANARLRWVGAETTGLVETARSKLDLSPLAAAALGRLLTGTAILHRLTAPQAGQYLLELRGDGPLGSVFAASDLEGRVRGTVTHRRADLPRAAAGKLPVGEGVGRGFLRSVREHGQESFQSQVELVSGEVGDDLAHFLEQSEQTRSAVLLGVLTRAEGIAAAGGLVIEALPDATEADVERLASNLAALGSVSRPIEEGGFEVLVERALAGLSPMATGDLPLRYACRCSWPKLRQHLAVLSPAERDELRTERGDIEAECVFCGSLYRYSDEDLVADAG